MSSFEATLATIAHRSDRPLPEVIHYHLLEGILRRVAVSPDSADFVLRGGMLTRLWVPLGQRIAVDVDFLGLYPFTISGTEQRFRALLANPRVTEIDGICFHLDKLETQGIWLDTPFPGVRVSVPAALESHWQVLQIDVGFGDPIVPAAQWIGYPTIVAGPAIRLQTVRPETMAGWKLHGLIERGAKRWRAKDLYDLMLLATLVPLDASQLPDAIRVAFNSRGADLLEVEEILTTIQWWNTGKHRRHWRWYCRKAFPQNTPEHFLQVATIVVRYWGPIIQNLGSSESDQRSPKSPKNIAE